MAITRPLKVFFKASLHSPDLEGGSVPFKSQDLDMARTCQPLRELPPDSETWEGFTHTLTRSVSHVLTPLHRLRPLE